MTWNSYPIMIKIANLVKEYTMLLKKLKYPINLIILLVLISLSVGPTYAESIQISGDQLLVRSGPGTEFEPIGHVNQGETHPVVEHDGDWIAIEFAGQTGWINSQFVTTLKDQPASPEMTDQSDQQDYFHIPFEHVNVRAQPTTDSDLIGELPFNEKIELGDTYEDWIEVTWNDLTGFIPLWIVEANPFEQTVDQSIFKGKTIVIDPGHGGVDVGAISITDHYESHYALYTAEVLRDQLSQLGADVVMTREDDYYYALMPRATLANYVHADVFISLHYNSEPQYPTATGINSYYRNESEQLLAEYVHNQLIEYTGANDRGVEYGNYLVLRGLSRPGILLELGFISNQEEEKQIQSHAYQRKITQGIIEGLQQYFLTSKQK